MQVELNRVETKKPTNQSDVGFSVSYDCISGARRGLECLAVLVV